jgi:putative salt-induced outer membrane protein YdiY
VHQLTHRTTYFFKYAPVFFFLLVCALLSFPAKGQIINVETMRLHADSSGWYGNLDISANLTKNTRKLWSFGSKINILKILDRHMFLLMGDLRFDKAQDVDLVNKGYQHFRYNYRLIKDKLWFLEAFEQIQFDAIRQIDRRFLLGLGVRNKLVSTEKVFLNLGTSFMFEEEKLKGEDRTLDSPRLNFYGNIQWHILKNTYFTTIFYYQPQLTNFSTFRLSSNSKLTIELSQHFAFKVVFELNYDNALQEDIPKLVYEFKNALSYKF